MNTLTLTSASTTTRVRITISSTLRVTLQGRRLLVRHKMWINQFLIILLIHHLIIPPLFFQLMDIMVSESSDSNDPSECVYQENEVVWAKIHGYPWWPAYVGQIQGDQLDTMLYTVYFFGDCSHSQINFEKLRKFQSYFPIFAQNARKNYKLKLALLSAQQQLRDNDENVNYFEILKPNKRGRKPLKTFHKQPSKVFSEASKDEQKSECKQQVIRRRPGRPRKVRPEQQKLQQIEQKQQILHVAQSAKSAQSGSKSLEEGSNDELLNTSLKQTQPSFKKMSEQENQLQYLSQLADNHLYKQAVTYLTALQVNYDNVIDILQMRVIDKLSSKVAHRQLQKFRELIKKTLLQKYFQMNNSSYDLDELKYHSIRGQTVRKILKMLRKITRKQSMQSQQQAESFRKAALEWERSIRQKNKDSDDYIKEIMKALIDMQTVDTAMETDSRTVTQIQFQLQSLSEPFN